MDKVQRYCRSSTSTSPYPEGTSTPLTEAPASSNNATAVAGNVEAAKTSAEATTNVTTSSASDAQVQVLLSASTITHPGKPIATINILHGANPAHAPSGTVHLVLDGNPLPNTLTVSGNGQGFAAA
jgi:hypothetical protein